MSAYDKTSIQINRCKRILELVDTYVDCPTQDYRTALRKALMEEFEAPAITPSVAAGSVNTDGMQRYTLDAGDMMEYATGNYVLHADAIAWGAQQREAGYARKISDAGQDRAAGLLCIERERAEKAEAERDTLKESLRLVNVDHGLWMTRTHAAEDARDDALARVKKLEEEMNRTAAGDAYFDLLPNQIVTK